MDKRADSSSSKITHQSTRTLLSTTLIYSPTTLNYYQQCAAGASMCSRQILPWFTDPLFSVRNVYLRCGHAMNLVSLTRMTLSDVANVNDFPTSA